MLNDLAKRIYDFNVSMGWRNYGDPPDLAVYLMNLHSEVSELWEAWRNNKVPRPGDAYIQDRILCDKAEKMREMGERPLTCAEEEIADILIRTLDTAQAMGIDVDEAVRIKMAYNATRPHRHGGKRA